LLASPKTGKEKPGTGPVRNEQNKEAKFTNPTKKK